MSGLLIAAPSSGAGKTTVTLGLLRALVKSGIAVAPGKAGPDYIDPAFHAAASGVPCFNFDPWGMRPDLLSFNAGNHRRDRLLVVEAMMGLFDGAADGSGTPADLAAALDLSVVLVVDCARMSQSVAALVSGFARYRGDVRVVGVILNRVGGDRHEGMLRDAVDRIDMPVFAVVRTDAGLALPERHLGLVQAGEHAGLEAFIERAAAAVLPHLDLGSLMAAAHAGDATQGGNGPTGLPPLGQRIAIASDTAFAFRYEHLLAGWRQAGAEIAFFSPLADEAPADDADAVYLPGGYPELHAGHLATATRFRAGMQAAAARDAQIFGECGGYMTLGEAMIDAGGQSHAMLGLLPLVTSFQTRRRHLGYRAIQPVPGGFFDKPMRAHEFHYATIVSEGEADRLFTARDARGAHLGSVGLRRGSVSGSFMHLIDIADEAA